MLPRDARSASSPGLFRFFPALPITNASERDERGEILIALRCSRDEGRGMTVDVQLRSNNRLHGTLTNGAVVLAECLVIGDALAGGILRWRHRFDGELCDATEVGAVGDTEMRISELARAPGQGFGRDGA